MIRLGVNIDHVATVRQARLGSYPDPLALALQAELAGADNITCHLREDRRHIQDHDVRRLKESLQIPLNLEIAARKEMFAFALELCPHAVTLVPEKRQELTTEGGLSLLHEQETLLQGLKQLREQGILVSLFLEAKESDMSLACELGAQAVELHTGELARGLARARTSQEALAQIKPFARAATLAYSLGMQVHFGHGLNYQNAFWLQCIPEAEEANIGHAIIAQALQLGMREAVKEMKRLLNQPDLKPF